MYLQSTYYSKYTYKIIGYDEKTGEKRLESNEASIELPKLEEKEPEEKENDEEPKVKENAEESKEKETVVQQENITEQQNQSEKEETTTNTQNNEQSQNGESTPTKTEDTTGKVNE